MNDGGKGSARRPGENYSEGWDRIFNKKRQHYFMHTGRGKYSCQVCGKLEDYCHDGETCPGSTNEHKTN